MTRQEMAGSPRETMKPAENPLNQFVIQQLGVQLKDRSDALVAHGDLRRPEANRQQEFLHHFFSELIVERGERADEVETDDVKKAAEIIERLFPFTTFGVFCTDGRMAGPLIFGFVPGIGGTKKTAGGDVADVFKNSKGELEIDPKSGFAGLITDFFKRKQKGDKPMAEVFDSHMGCAARGGIEKAKGRQPNDGGLFADVWRKKGLSNAVRSFVADKFPKQEILPIQFSFDPHTGFGIMGLDTQFALESAEKAGGFTTEVISKLMGDGKVANTIDVARDNHEEFEQFRFDLNWRNNYAQSALKFWQSMEALSQNETVMKRIAKRVEGVFGKLPKNEAKQRSLLLLANAFNGYLHNINGEYPYGVHKETCFVVEERSNGPFEIAPPFLLHPDNLKLPDDIYHIANTIVRDNRLQGRISDRSGVYKTPEQFAAAPVPGVLKGIVREKLSTESWDVLRSVDWGKMPTNWDTMEEEDFHNWLRTEGKGELKDAIVTELLRLRRRMISLRKDPSLYDFLSTGHIEILCGMTDKSRRFQCLIPFRYAKKENGAN